MKLRKWNKRILTGGLILLPVSALAFFGSEDVILGKILAEAMVHTQSLQSMLNGLNFLSATANDVRRGIEDPLSLEVDGLSVRDLTVDNLLRQAGAGPVLNTIQNGQVLKQQIESVWGQIPRTANSLALTFKDDQALSALSFAAAISQEARTFSDAGQDLLGDLDEAHEGKATIRHAQAGALQVQQLSQIEANQGLQISLAAQNALSSNEKEKAIHEVNHRYLDMLNDAFLNLKPMGPNQ